MSSEVFIKNLENKMEQSIVFFKKDIQSVKVGRANPGLLDPVLVETPYGSTMRVKELATWNNPDPRQLIITPFDKQMTAAIAKAIEKADIGLKVSNEGALVRLTAPLIDESVRKEAIKTCKKKAENGRVSIRSLRKDANSALKNMQLTEDEVRRIEKQVQKLTDKFCEEIDKFLENLEKDLMTC